MSTLKVEVLRIEDIRPHPNADKLELLMIRGWTIVEKKDRFKVNDSVIYFPIDSIIPLELSDRIGCTQYLSKQRVKAAKLRGIVSCGVAYENVENLPLETDLTEKLGVTKWEPPDPPAGNTGGQNRREPGPFHHYTNIENWNNHPRCLEAGEEVVVTEKIHGTNWRAGLINDEFLIGSHRNAKAFDEKIVYWQAALKYSIEEKMRAILPYARERRPVPNWVLFGEVFGAVQDLRYGLGKEIDLRVFDISEDGRYVDYDELEYLCKWMELPMAPVLYRGPYDAKHLAELAEGLSFQGEHIREGVVVRPIKERWHDRLGRLILKKINPEYLVRKKGTEHH